MTFLSWRLEKKLTIFFVAFGSLTLLAFIFVYFNLPAPTCFDNRQNQDEEGVDCGGSCATPCVKQPKDIVTLWTRVLEINEGVYDVISFIENPNLNYGMPKFKYTFKIFNEQNILLTTREGQSYVNPQDNFIIFETGITTGNLKPARAFMEIQYLSDWKYVQEFKLPLVVSEKRFVNQPAPSLEIKLSNQSLFDLRNIYMAAVLYDESGNAIGASLSKIENISPETVKVVVFTWPKAFSNEPVSSRIFMRSGFRNEEL